MAGRTSISRPGVNIAVFSVTGVVATFLTAFLFEALTDRDWSISHWEWPQVLALALLSTLGAFWLLAVPSARRRRIASRQGRGEVAAEFIETRSPNETPIPRIGDQFQAPSRRLTPRRVGLRRTAGSRERRFVGSCQQCFGEARSASGFQSSPPTRILVAEFGTF
jgi:hypothetical protein